MTRHAIVLLVALVSLAANLACAGRVVVVSNDTAWAALSVGVLDGDVAEVTDSTLWNVALPKLPAYSGRAFVPALLDLRGNGSRVVIRNSTLWTTCASVQEHADFLQAVSPAASFEWNYTLLRVSSFSSAVVSVSQAVLRCKAGEPLPVLQMDTGQGRSSFQSAFNTLAETQLGASITLHGVGRASNTFMLTKGPIHVTGVTDLSSSSGSRAVWDFEGLPATITLDDSLVFSLTNVTLVNSCLFVSTFPAIGNATFMASNMVASIKRSRSRLQPLLFANTVHMITRWEMEALTYWTAIYPSPFPKVVRYADLFRAWLPDAQSITSNPNSNSLVMLRWVAISHIMTNVTLWAVDAPLAGFPYAEVPLLPPRMCQDFPGLGLAGDVLPDHVKRLSDDKLRPLYILPPRQGGSIAALVMQVQAWVTAPSPSSQDFYLPPIFMLFSNISLLDAIPPPPAAPVFLRDVLWVGPNAPTAGVEGNPTHVAFDLANATRRIVLGAQNQAFYLQRLTLKNLAVASENDPEIALGPRTVPTALPLWAFSYGRSSVQLLMDSVTIELPVADFAAIHALAKIGGLERLASARRALTRQTTALANRAIDEVSVFDVARWDSGCVVLNSWAAWGVSGTNVKFLPAGPYVDTEPVLSGEGDAGTAAADSMLKAPQDSSEDVTWRVLVGVVVGIGGLLLAAAAVVIAMLWRRWRKPMAGRVDSQGDVEAEGLGDKDRNSARDAHYGAGSKCSSHAGGGGGPHANGNGSTGRKSVTVSVNHSGVSNGAAAALSASQHALSADSTVVSSKLVGASPKAHHKEEADDSFSVGDMDGGCAVEMGSGSERTKGSMQSPSPRADDRLHSSLSLPPWDPMKEIQQITNGLPGCEGEKLTILEPIGSGGFGSVYKGRWRNLEVAVKTVLFCEKRGKQGGRSSDAPHQRAVMEAAVSSSVVHPNVVCTYHYDIKPIKTIHEPGQGSGMQIDDTGENSNWKLYLVQELCHASLADALVSMFMHDKQTKRPHLNLALGVLMDVANGMVYIHSKNIIHGDLKPENVLLKHDPTSAIGMIAKITDFGLCTTIDPTQSHISGFTNGTPFYTAPEVSSTGRGTRASDTFSFGILMVEVYRCMPPWVKTAKGYRPNKAFHQFPPGSPRPYMRLAAWCLDKNPKSRPRFEDVVSALHQMNQRLMEGWFALETPQEAAEALAAEAIAAAAAAHHQQQQQLLAHQQQHQLFINGGLLSTPPAVMAQPVPGVHAVGAGPPVATGPAQTQPWLYAPAVWSPTDPQSPQPQPQAQLRHHSAQQPDTAPQHSQQQLQPFPDPRATALAAAEADAAALRLAGAAQLSRVGPISREALVSVRGSRALAVVSALGSGSDASEHEHNEACGAPQCAGGGGLPCHMEGDSDEEGAPQLAAICTSRPTVG